MAEATYSTTVDTANPNLDNLTVTPCCTPYHAVGNPDALPLSVISQLYNPETASDVSPTPPVKHHRHRRKRSDPSSSTSSSASTRQWLGGHCDEKFAVGTIENQVCRYSSSDKVKKFLSYLKAHAIHGYAYGKCKKFVRVAAEASGLLKPFKNTADPKDFAEMHGDPSQGQLAKQGFVNLMDPKYHFNISKPSDAPPGAILVYEKEGYGHYGHAEVRTDEEGSRRFGSDFSNHNAYTHDRLSESFPMHFGGSGSAKEVTKKLIGVFVKLDQPDEG